MHSSAHAVTHAAMLRVVDLFAGLGGFAAGAIEASESNLEGGAVQVVLGVDNDPVPLKLWAANVGPGARVVLATLGPDSDPLPEMPPPAKDLHVHASTPCTSLSSAKQAATEADVMNGVAMMRWAIDLLLARGDHSWSIENVSTPTTRKILDEYRARFPDQVAYATLCASDFGACQTRVRLIAAPPLLIRRLQEMPAAKRLSVREAFAQHGLEVPAPCFKNQSMRSGGAPCMRNVEMQSHTVCASDPLTWTSNDGCTVRVMSPRESAVLMGFPATWRLPTGSRVGQRAVGNALCVAMSKAIVEASLSMFMADHPPVEVVDHGVNALVANTQRTIKRPHDAMASEGASTPDAAVAKPIRRSSLLVAMRFA